MLSESGQTFIPFPVCMKTCPTYLANCVVRGRTAVLQFHCLVLTPLRAATERIHTGARQREGHIYGDFMSMYSGLLDMLKENENWIEWKTAVIFP